MKKSVDHIGKKIKRFRSFRGMTQEELATAIGKTRSLVSFFERTGNINKYTLMEIAQILDTTVEELETGNFGTSNTFQEQVISSQKKNDSNQLIEQQQAEINFLKETINHQWELLKSLAKGK